VIDEFNKLKERQKYIRGLITWIGFKQIPYYYNREERYAGETHYPFWKMVSFATRGLLYFSKKPLNIATNLGLASVIISLLFLIYFLIQKVYHPDTLIQGWISIISLVIFFGGVQLLTIGLLGSYVGNMFDEVKERPEYIIKEILG
jgi:polyisoprenyl-phosphate glycosyltransferase